MRRKSRAEVVACSNCGRPAQVETGAYRFSESGLRNVLLVGIDLIRCPHCKNVDPIIPYMNGLMKVLAAAVAGKPYRLRGKEIRFLRKYLRLSGADFASLLGADKTTISKWENDADVPGERADRLIRAVALCLGEGLQEHVGDIVRKFPEIKSVLDKALKYRLDPANLTCEYA